VRRLHVTLHFLPVAVRSFDLIFVEPTSRPAHVQAALAQQLHALIWPGEVEQVELEVLDVGELVAGQLPLFDATLADGDESSAALAELAQRWSGRYGRCFFVGQVADAHHPVHERVHQWQAL
jgi:hypothetical protein